MAELKNQLFGNEQVYKGVLAAAKAERLATTHVFVGPSGVGKFRVALAISQALMCEKNAFMACGHCGPCGRVEKKQMESLFVVESETAIIKLDVARDLKDFLRLQAMRQYRIIIIRDAEKMNVQTANALLKLLEEPPDGTLIFLISSSTRSLLPTINSRSQIWRFSPLKIDEMKKIVEAPDWMYSASQGRMDLLESLLSSDGNVVKASVCWSFKEILKGNIGQVLPELREQVKDKNTYALWVRFCQQILRDAMTYNSKGSELIHPDQSELLTALAQKPKLILDEVFHLTHELEEAVRRPYDKVLAVENFAYQTHARFSES